jgi:hypothetical protein
MKLLRQAGEFSNKASVEFATIKVEADPIQHDESVLLGRRHCSRSLRHADRQTHL